jgi:hypothetical protein
LATIPDNATDFAVGNTKALLSGKLYLAAGQRVAAEPLLRQARAELEERARSLPPGYFRAYAIHLSLAEIDALLGDESSALKSTAAALELLPIDKDAMEGQDNLAGAVRVYAELGRVDLVVPALKQLRSRPGDTNISANLLRLDPVWDKVRADPGFQAEIQRYAELDQP